MPGPKIETFVSEFTNQLTTLIRRTALEQVLAAMGGDGSPLRRGPGPPRGSGLKSGRPARASSKPAASGKRIRRSTEDLDLLSQQLLDLIRARPGSVGNRSLRPSAQT